MVSIDDAAANDATADTIVQWERAAVCRIRVAAHDTGRSAAMPSIRTRRPTVPPGLARRARRILLYLLSNAVTSTAQPTAAGGRAW